MLSLVEVYTSKLDVDELEVGTRPDLDFLYLTRVDGVNPVPVSISSTSLPSADVSVISGEEVPARNIVLYVIPNPNWSTWTPEKLRRLIYAYFTPKSTVRMVFTTTEIDYPVEITGEVESVEYDQFSEDATYQISILCADPYFTSTHEKTIDGEIMSFDGWPPSDPVNIGGDVPIGCRVKIADGFESGELFVQSGDPSISTFHIVVGSDNPNPTPNVFEMDSRPLRKKVRTYQSGSGTITNLLRALQPGYEAVWPVLEPGNNLFAVMGDSEGTAWQLLYFERFSGL